ncbi:MAG: alpha/beta hydrolase [Rhodospirillales bacterium]|nr:MAG: alpha/beta hydrolase [Rhodospirillales bacterium]
MDDQGELLQLLNDVAVRDLDGVERAFAEQSLARLRELSGGLTAKPRFVTASDGLELGYRHYPGESSRVLILIHGAAGHGGHLHVFARSIAQQGAASVYVPDMRGHGLSGRRRGHAVAYPEQMVEDVAVLLGEVARDHPGAPIVLGGHSAGGGLVIRCCAAALGERVSGMLLLAPFLGHTAPTTRPRIGGWVAVYRTRMSALIALNARGITGLNDLPVVEFNQPAATLDGRETLSWSYNTLLAFGPGNAAAELERAGANRPMLVMVGTDDECFVADAYPAVMAGAAPASEVRLLPGLGHWDLLTDSAAADIALDWLGRL